MSFHDDEISLHSGEPIELIEFTAASGTVYRYTGYGETVNHGGNDFEAVPVLRSPIQGRSGERSSDVIIELPYNIQVVQDFAFDVAERNLSVTIYRKHGLAGTAVTWFEGVVALITIEGSPPRAKFQIPSQLADAVKQGVPEHVYLAQCPHTLYDVRCGLDVADFDEPTAIVTVDGTAIEVGTVGAVGDQTFRGGEIIRDSDGERRMIVSQIGTDLIINTPFKTLAALDAVTLTQGCDRLKATCESKFSNVENFGGHPTIPSFNVFAADLRRVLR